MRRHPSCPWTRLALFALSLSLAGCGPTLPPAPEDPTPPAETRPLRDSGQGAVPRAFTSAGPSTPVDMRSDAPSPEARPQGNVLTQPGQPSCSLEDLQGGLPAEIPQQMAGSLLRPLDGPMADVRAPGLDPGLGDGCAYGALPDLLDYGVYPRLLYYPFRSFWVPYILVDDCYYPYVYQPYFDPLYAGNCFYPLFYYSHGFYYPYYFHSRSYYYGYLDWEYNWPRYRERHGDYDWSDIGRRHPRRYNEDDFDQWRRGKVRRRDRADWQRSEPRRRRQGVERKHSEQPERDTPRLEGRIERGLDRVNGERKRHSDRLAEGERPHPRSKERHQGARSTKGHKGGRRLQSEDQPDADQDQ